MNQSLGMLVMVATLFASTGCRSMPGRNMFGLRSQPSAEALAGSGPTMTYPAPPSDSANPEAIASIAGGTGSSTPSPETKSPTTAQVAGVDVSPGFATPASNTQPTNMAAAQANGIYSGNDQGGTSNSAATASAYAFGSKALTPKSDPSTTETSPASTATPTATAGSAPTATTGSSAADSPTGGSAYALNSSYPIPGEKLNTPTTSVTPPAQSKYNGVDPSITADDLALPTASPGTDTGVATATAPTTGGYTMPSDSPAVASITPPASAASGASDSAAAGTPFAPPATTTPDFSTASAAGSVSAPSSVATPSSALPKAGTGYMPGSTSTNHGYPTGELESEGSGSFYR